MLRKAMLLVFFGAVFVCVCAASNNSTSPINIPQAAKTIETVSSNDASTAPVNSIENNTSSVNTVMVNKNIATAYWVELIPYPPATRKLNLMVDGLWRVLIGPSDSNLASVQNSLSNSSPFQVLVWYTPRDSKIVGLAVSTK